MIPYRRQMGLRYHCLKQFISFMLSFSCTPRRECDRIYIQTGLKELFQQVPTVSPLMEKPCTTV